MQLLTSGAEGIDLSDLPDEFARGIANRILKALAIRGLVKVTADGRWAPSAAFLLGAELPLHAE